MSGASPDSNTYLFPNSFNGNLGQFTQAPSAATWFTLDYSTWVSVDQTVVSAAFTVTPVTGPALVVSDQIIIASGATAALALAFLVSGGSAGQRYNVSVATTFSDGAVKTDQFVVSVVPINGTSLGVSTISTPTGSANLLAGTGAPAPGLGEDGDYYVDTAATLLYGPRAAGAWPSPGIPFMGGNILAGNTSGAPPSNSIGVNGGYFLDISSGFVFGPKAGGVWPSSSSAIEQIALPGTPLLGTSGGTAPANTIGIDGNYFIDLSSGSVFGPKASGVWPGTGTPLDPTTAANIVYGNSSGSPPANTVGANGQYFLDFSSGKVFGPKASGAWPASTGSLFPLVTNAGAANGVATLDSGGTLVATQVPLTLLNFKGSWNASANSPALISGVGTKGQFYEVSVAGSTILDGFSPWNVGDLVWFNGSAWSRISAATSAGVGGQAVPPQGRLTMLSGGPTTPNSGSTVFYTPYIGNLVPIWSGSAFVSTVFSELSQTLTDSTKSPTAAATGQVYDMFVWNDAGTLRCTRGPAWATGGGSNTTRGAGAGLTRVNGVLVNASAITNGPGAGAGTYVGTIAVDPGSLLVIIEGGTTVQTAAIGLWNMYNRVEISVTAWDSGASYTYSSASFREAHGVTYNNIYYVVGWPEDVPVASLSTFTNNPSGPAKVGIGWNNSSGTPPDEAVDVLPTGSSIDSHLSYTLPLTTGGLNTVYSVEASDGTHAATFNANSTNTLRLTIRM